MIFIFVILLILLLIALISVINALTFPRLKKGTPLDTPLVSVLIPARNEASHIVDTLISLKEQSYPDFELILLDDNSNDGTLELAQQSLQGNPRAKVIQGQPLPIGWLGKNWACHQLAQHARGELLIFTDADVHWKFGTLSAVVSLHQRTNADMLTIWPTQRTNTWSERLIVPMMMFVIIGYLPEILVRYTPWPVFAAANGQCLIFRRAAYNQIGGHQGVRNNIIEDMGLAKKIKRCDFRLVMALGDHLIYTRMYTKWKEVRDGFAKNILAGHGGQLLFLVFSAVFHWCLFLLPWALLLSELLASGSPYRLWLSGISVFLGIGIRALSAGITHQRIKDAILLPVSVVLMSIIAARPILWYFQSDGPEWKDRPISIRS